MSGVTDNDISRAGDALSSITTTYTNNLLLLQNNIQINW